MFLIQCLILVVPQNIQTLKCPRKYAVYEKEGCEQEDDADAGGCKNERINLINII